MIICSTSFLASCYNGSNCDAYYNKRDGQRAKAKNQFCHITFLSISLFSIRMYQNLRSMTVGRHYVLRMRRIIYICKKMQKYEIHIWTDSYILYIICDKVKITLNSIVHLVEICKPCDYLILLHISRHRLPSHRDRVDYSCFSLARTSRVVSQSRYRGRNLVPMQDVVCTDQVHWLDIIFLERRQRCRFSCR